MRKESPGQRKCIFPELVIKSVGIEAVNEFDLTRAQELRSMVLKHRKSGRSISAKKWAIHFAKLRLIDKLKKKRIRETLTWYLAHFGQQYIPEAFSGLGFRNKFYAIESAKKRHEEDEPTKTTKQARSIHAKLSTLNWPKGSAKGLMEAIQRSLDSYADFMNRRQDTIKAIAYGDRELSKAAMRKFIGLNTQLDHYLTSPSSFVVTWLRLINGAVANWEEWSGDLKAMAFKPTAKRFRNLGRGWAQEYCGDPDRFDFYLETIYAS